MANTINLIPVKTKEEVKKQVTKYRGDLITAVFILGVVILAVITVFINALLQFDITALDGVLGKATSTLSTYRGIAQGYYTVDQKIVQMRTISHGRLNPDEVLTYIAGILPANASLSNFTFSDNNQFIVTISSNDYIAVAKFLVTLENTDLRLKSTEIKQITFDHTQNIENFTISGTYVPNATTTSL